MPTRLVESLLAMAGGRDVDRLAPEVREVRATDRAADDVEVEGQIVRIRGVERIEEVAAQLLARGAGQAAAPPDGTQSVQGGVAAVLADVLEPGPQLRGVAEGLLDPRRGLGGQGLGQVGTQGLVVDQGGHRCSLRGDQASSSSDSPERRAISLS